MAALAKSWRLRALQPGDTLRPICDFNPPAEALKKFSNPGGKVRQIKMLVGVMLITLDD
jgi:hypothetical protein